MGKVLITGASRGIGLALTREYLSHGAQVIATCRDPDRAHLLTGLAAEYPLLAVEQLDVTQAASIGALALRRDGEAIDVLINNAGLFDDDQRPGELDYDAWRMIFETNTIGVLAMIEAFLSALQRAARPVVTGISSALGSIQTTTGGRYFYRASKAALNMVIRSLAIDYREAGIIFAVLSPGLVDTELTQHVDKPKISAAHSARGIHDVILGLTPAMSGGFYRYDGGELPW